MFKITQLMLNRKVNENKKNIGINSQCLQVKYDAETNTISTSNIRSTRYKKYVVELIKSNLAANNLVYNENQLELITIDDSCKYYEYKIEAQLDEEVAAYELKVEQEEDERDEKERRKKDKETERKKVLSQKKKELDEIFYEHWINKIKALKDLIPNTENHFTGKGRDKKYKSYFRKQTTLFFEAQEFYGRS